MAHSIPRKKIACLDNNICSTDNLAIDLLSWRTTDICRSVQVLLHETMDARCVGQTRLHLTARNAHLRMTSVHAVAFGMADLPRHNHILSSKFVVKPIALCNVNHTIG